MNRKFTYFVKNSPFLSSLARPFRAVLKKRWERQNRRHPLRRMRNYFKVYFGREPDLDHPRTMYEKIIWLEYCSDISLWTRLTDKVEVREFVRSRGLGEYLNEVYTVWDTMPSYDEFVAALPERCVVKTTHTGGSEGVFIISDRSSADLRDIYRRLGRSFSDRYGERTAQPHYLGIRPRIIVERLLINDLVPGQSMNDYKFFCLNGEPVFINAIGDRDMVHGHYIDQFYDLDMKPYIFAQQPRPKPLPVPASLPRMVSLARQLSQGMPFVRVDFYEQGGRPVFGEMTFTPGLDYFVSGYGEETLRLGERLDISGVPQTRRITPDMY